MIMGLEELLLAAASLETLLTRHGWRFCFIGGVAVQRWSDPRFTDDLIVHKAFAGRDLDWADVERILIRQHEKLNFAQIRAELKPLLELKGQMEGLQKLEQKIATVEGRLRAKA